jgi:hypothetical protein
MSVFILHARGRALLHSDDLVNLESFALTSMIWQCLGHVLIQ